MRYSGSGSKWSLVTVWWKGELVLKTGLEVEVGVRERNPSKVASSLWSRISVLLLTVI